MSGWIQLLSLDVSKTHAAFNRTYCNAKTSKGLEREGIDDKINISQHSPVGQVRACKAPG